VRVYLFLERMTLVRASHVRRASSLFRYSRSPLGARQSTDVLYRLLNTQCWSSGVEMHWCGLLMWFCMPGRWWLIRMCSQLLYRFWLGQRKLYAIFSLSPEELKNPLSSDPLWYDRRCRFVHAVGYSDSFSTPHNNCPAFHFWRMQLAPFDISPRDRGARWSLPQATIFATQSCCSTHNYLHYPSLEPPATAKYTRPQIVHAQLIHTLRCLDSSHILLTQKTNLSPKPSSQPMSLRERFKLGL